MAQLKYDGTVLNGTEISFTTSSESRAPTVSTKNATNITVASATLNMAYDFMDYSSVKAQFRYQVEGTSAWNETCWVAQSGSVTHSFSEPIAGLSSNTTYYFMALLKYDGTVLNGTGISFTTSREPRPPTVCTENATNISSTSATLNMAYEFMDYSAAQVQFRYKAEGASAWNETGWVTQSGSGTHSFSKSIVGLSSNKTYYFMAQLKYDGTVLNGTEISFTTSRELRPPTVTTKNATNITTASATLNMAYDFMDYSSVHVHFRYKVEGANAWDETGWVAQTGSGSHSFSEPIVGLSSNTTHYFMAQLKYDGTVLNGTEISFTTSEEARPPAVTTKNATNITTTAATLNMTYEFVDYSSVHVQFRYKAEGASEWNETGWVAQSGSGSHSFSEPIVGLSSNMTHYFMAQLKYDRTVLNGTEVSFTTSGELRPPVVTTKNATNITAASATLNMTYDFMDYSSVQVQFRYKAEGVSEWNETGWISQTGSGSHSFSEPIAGLSSNTTHYFMAQLKYDGTVLNGTEISFTTSGESRPLAKTILIYNADAVIDITASMPPDDTLDSSDALAQDGVKTILIYNADAFIDITASTPPDDALNSSDALPQDGVKTILIYNADAFIDITASTPPDDALNSSDALPQDGVKTILIYNADAVIDITASTPPDGALDSSDALPQDGVKTILIYDADATDSLSLKAISTGEYDPKLEIPVYAPKTQTAPQGTKLTYIINVTNEGNVEDIIELTVSKQSISENPEDWWEVQFSSSSVVLAPKKSEDILVNVLIPKSSFNINLITIRGESSSAKNCFAEVKIIADGIDEASVLFGSRFYFTKSDSKQHKLEFEIPGFAEITDDQIIPPENVAVVYNPRNSGDLDNTYIKIHDLVDGEETIPPVTLPIKFTQHADKVITTAFDMQIDAYHFSNNVWNGGKCYGMAATSVLYFIGKLPLPLDTTTYDLTLTNEMAMKFIDDYQESWRYNNIIATWLELFGNNKLKKDDFFGFGYNDLNGCIGNEEPMIFFLGGKGPGAGHAVVAYRIVEDEESKAAYILIYDPNWPYEFNYFLEAYPYIIYNREEEELSPYYGYTKFKLAKAEPFYKQIMYLYSYITFPAILIS